MDVFWKLYNCLVSIDLIQMSIEILCDFSNCFLNEKMGPSISCHVSLEGILFTLMVLYVVFVVEWKISSHGFFNTIQFQKQDISECEVHSFFDVALIL